MQGVKDSLVHASVNKVSIIVMNNIDLNVGSLTHIDMFFSPMMNLFIDSSPHGMFLWWSFSSWCLHSVIRPAYGWYGNVGGHSH